jgi:hypothetical protein
VVFRKQVGNSAVERSHEPGHPDDCLHKINRLACREVLRGNMDASSAMRLKVKCRLAAFKGTA